MFDIQHYGSFIAAIVVFQLVPGPGTLAILGATARNGIGAGMGAVLGTLLGDFIYMLSAVLGLAAVLAATPTLFSAMRWLGIAYLCYIGLKLLFSKTDGDAPEESAPRSGWLHFRRALAVALTNPKVVMFFFAFFPLFMTADARPTTLAAMMVHVTGISFLYQAGLVLVGNAAARRLSRIRGVRTIATRLAGMALVGFGVRLALDDR